jgi:LPPG:FO 2-phospho-L-lactate transferase
MADQPRRTRIDTPAGASTETLPFQEWFVRERCRPEIARIWFEGSAEPAPDVIDAITGAELVIIGPSNPYVSIDPILTLHGVRDALATRPVIALCPIVGGKAVKGPLAEMIVKLAGKQPSAAAVVDHYRERYGDILDGMVIERGDEDGITGPRVLATSAIMSDIGDRARLAREILAFGETLA